MDRRQPPPSTSTASSSTTTRPPVLIAVASAQLRPRTVYNLAAPRGSMPAWPQGRGRTHERHHHALRALREPVPSRYSLLHAPLLPVGKAWMPSSPAVALRGSILTGASSERMIGSNLLSAAKAQQAPPVASAQAAAIPAAVSIVHAMGHSVVGSGTTFLLTRGLADQTTEGVLAPHVLADIGITTMVDLADSFANEEEVRAAVRSAAQTAQDLAVQAWTQCRRRAPHLARLRVAQGARPAPATSPSTSPPLAPVLSVPPPMDRPAHPLPLATPPC